MMGSLKGLVFAAVAAGLVCAGCQGPPGPAGPPGPGGGLSVYQRSTGFTCTSGGPNCNVPILVAECDPGDFAVSGTAYREAPGFPDQDRVSFPQPRGVATAPTGWATSQGNMPDGNTITVVALCADQTP